jgi:hypothetical protein
MSKQQIREEDREHDKWYEAASKVTLSDLPQFLRHLTEDYKHDYGTICHAIAAGMTATMAAMNASPQGGITGFQAGCIKWCVLEHAFWEKGPMRLVKYEDLMFPQYADRFTSISPDTWSWLQEQAKSKLASGCSAHPDVLAHWRSIADGVVPFGLAVVAA